MKTPCILIAAALAAISPASAQPPETDLQQTPHCPYFITPHGGSSLDGAKLEPTPFLGVATSPVPAALAAQFGLDEDFGVVIDSVIEDSPAAAAGLERFDVIKRINDQRVSDSNHLAKLVRSFGEGAEVTVTLMRKGQDQEKTVKLGRRMEPADDRAGRPIRLVDFLRRIPQGDNETIFEWAPAPAADPNSPRRFEKQLRQYQEQLATFQKQMQEWAQTREGEMPKLPPVPKPPIELTVRVPQVESDPAPAVSDPAGETHETSVSSTASSGHSESRAVMKDADGEATVVIRDGKRTLTAKDSAGKIVFDGPIDTADQRAKVPPAFQKSLKSIETLGQKPVETEIHIETGPANAGALKR